MPSLFNTLPLALVLLTGAVARAADEGRWVELTPAGKALDAWNKPAEEWRQVAGVKLDEKNPRRLAAQEGEGVWYNGAKGRCRDLLSREKFADLEVSLEFCIPKGSNSGVKLMGLYEIQILDTQSAKALSGDSCGGIYPRAEERPQYHHIDKGVAPLVNAARPAGEWQTLHILFQAPRFDAEGKKTASARFLKVTLNDQRVHENVEVQYPTGAAWRLRKETPTGPLLLQADHGPVAFRKVKVRPLTPGASK